MSGCEAKKGGKCPEDCDCYLTCEDSDYMTQPGNIYEGAK